MIDAHVHPENWGIMPVLFRIGNTEISSYSFFVLLGLLVGIVVYIFESQRKKVMNENGFLIAIGSFVGGVLGAKILQWSIDYEYFFEHFSNPEDLLSGRTIVGGLLGGTLGAILTKRILRIRERRGNLFAPGIALGVAIGRLGCFLEGCCYGKPTILPWGVDFGDGVLRHPTQIYESIFMLGMFWYLQTIKDNKEIQPGQLFSRLMISYFTFRFFVEFLRVERVAFWGLSVFQIIALGVVIFLLAKSFFQQKKVS